MITTPGAAMLDGKLFVSRLDDPYPDLYERLWDGVEWIWVNHGRPEGLRMKGPPGAAMNDDTLFVVVDDGSLWERHHRADLRRWVWQDHGRPGNRPIEHGPSAAMLDQKLFVVTDDGSLWERHWRSDLDRWVWNEHGRPANRPIVTEPGAAMLGEKLFVVTDDGSLWERHWRSDLDAWVWSEHGRPDDRPIEHAPGAAMLGEKLFVVTRDGELWERHWRSDLGRWVWNSHGRPSGTRLATAPGAAMLDAKLFVGGDDGHLYERAWEAGAGRWAWLDHGRPAGQRVRTAPGAAMLDSKLFMGTNDGHLVERLWTGREWAWSDHGTAFHDRAQHVIGEPGTDPKLTVVVMGDGFAERDMDAYHRLVENRVVAAFRKDELGANAAKVRLIRIDVVSPVSGVTQRDYDEQGTSADSSDDVLEDERVRQSRLGFISTGLWSHCWLETSAITNPRVQSIQQRFEPAATQIVVLVNDGRPGGCNRGNLAAFTRGESDDVVAHELGHNIFDLGDEYANDTRTNTALRAEPNLTETPSAWTNLKWIGFVAPGTPLPTSPSALPSGWNAERSVGAFAGGGGRFSTGIFRPVLRCRMNQNNPPWCPVCGAAIDTFFSVFP